MLTVGLLLWLQFMARKAHKLELEAAERRRAQRLREAHWVSAQAQDNGSGGSSKPRYFPLAAFESVPLMCHQHKQQQQQRPDWYV